jgi:membrane-bound metal-dependent hydrolase YbcI (DUF457 family)
MPFTPFHLVPALLFGLLLFAFFDFPTFVVANVIVDLEPLLVIYLGLYNYPLHGFFHSFIGGTIVAVILALVMFKLSGFSSKLMKPFRLEQKTSWKKILAASLLGVYFHILLDAPLYPEMRPFFPLNVNPFFFNDLSVFVGVYMFCIFSLFAGFIAYVTKLAAQLWHRT